MKLANGLDGVFNFNSAADDAAVEASVKRKQSKERTIMLEIPVNSEKFFSGSSSSGRFCRHWYRSGSPAARQKNLQNP